MSDRLTELMAIHAGTEQNLRWDKQTREWVCRCGEVIHAGRSYTEARERYPEHLARVVRQHLREASLPWTSGAEARNTAVAMAQARADEMRTEGWLPGIDDVPEAGRSGWDR